MPDSAVAYASLSRICRFLTIFEVADPWPLWDEAERPALCAVEMDRSLSEAQSSLACVLARYRWQWREARAAYEQALQLNPADPETCCDYGEAQLAMGQYEEGARIQLTRGMRQACRVRHAANSGRYEGVFSIDWRTTANRLSGRAPFSHMLSGIIVRMITAVISLTRKM